MSRQINRQTDCGSGEMQQRRALQQQITTPAQKDCGSSGRRPKEMDTFNALQVMASKANRTPMNSPSILYILAESRMERTMAAKPLRRTRHDGTAIRCVPGLPVKQTEDGAGGGSFSSSAGTSLPCRMTGCYFCSASRIMTPHYTFAMWKSSKSATPRRHVVAPPIPVVEQ